MKKLLSLFAVIFLLCVDAFAQNNNPELPAIKAANAKDFFISSAVCKKYNLTEAKGDAWMKVYNNLEKDAKLQRVNDIRWEAASAAEAKQWYSKNIQMLSEGYKDVTANFPQPAATGKWNVYITSDAMKKMMNSMGVIQNQYIYTFTVDKYVAKIFLGVNEATSLKESWSFAKEGLIALLKASGNPKLAALVL